MSNYIPPELIENILARLPTKDVLRCKIVCKSWYDLITSSSFTSLHLKLSTPNQKPRIFIKYNRQRFHRTTQYCLHDGNQILEKISGLDPLLTRSKFELIGSFNGLYLLYTYSLRDAIAVLWNPSLRKSIVLPKHRVLSENYRHVMGFSFLPTTNDYKVVRLSFINTYRSDKVIGQIYELSTGSWRDMVATIQYFTPYYIEQCTPQAFLNDAVHWKAFDRICRIGTFNMKNESFGTLAVPTVLRYRQDFTVSTFQESLCLATTKYEGKYFCSIWVMKEYGVTDSWVKQFKIELGYFRSWRPTHVYFKENGEILLENYVFDWEEHKLSSNLVYYDPILNEVIDCVRPSNSASGCNVHSYVESLVLDNIPNHNENEENRRKGRRSRKKMFGGAMKRLCGLFCNNNNI